jgi:hypothetical protein
MKLLDIQGLILFNPTMKWIDQIILKSQLKEALIHYAKDYCGQEIIITNLDIPIYGGPLWRECFWNAESEPEIKYLQGAIGDSYVTLSSVEKCNLKRLILNREERTFIDNGMVDLPLPQQGFNTSKFFAYFWVILIGFFVWILIYSREQKEKTKA